VSFGWLLVGESSLAGIGLAWCWLRGLPVPYRANLGDLALAAAASAGLMLVNFGLYHLGKKTGRPVSVHAFLEAEIFPLFRGVSVGLLLLLAAVAGLGEELLFRGVLQVELGIGVASILFGLLHGPTRDLWPLAVWATAMGLVLGILYQASGNLLVPTMAHALYDGAALIYVSRRESLGPMDTIPKEG
jgi:CAAX protease family protein